jgi:hypothetical protein
MGRLWALLEPIVLVAFGLDLLLLLHDGSRFGSRGTGPCLNANWSAPALMMAASERRPRGVIFGRPLKLTAQQRKEGHPATRGRAVGRFGPVPRREPSHH